MMKNGTIFARPYLIGRIEDVRVIYESSTLDENIELLNHQDTVEETAARWSFFLLAIIMVLVNLLVQHKHHPPFCKHRLLLLTPLRRKGFFHHSFLQFLI